MQLGLVRRHQNSELGLDLRVHSRAFLKATSPAASLTILQAFHAVGFLTGPNAAFSWLFGAVLAYGIIGPSLYATGASFARPIDPTVPGWFNHFSMSTISTFISPASVAKATNDASLSQIFLTERPTLLSVALATGFSGALIFLCFYSELYF